MTKAAFRSHFPVRPAVRYESGDEPCGRCGKPTVEKLLKKGRADQPQVFIECPACGWCRPAAEAEKQ